MGAADAALPQTHMELLALLDGLGLPTNHERRLCANIEEVLTAIDSWEERRKGLPYETDGLVIKLNDLGARDRLGATSKSPRGLICL